MDAFLKLAAGVLIAAILYIVLSGQAKELSLLLSISVCVMALVVALSYISPVLDFASRLIRLSKLSNQLLQVLMKAVGIGFLSHIVGMICEDAGNQSLSKAIHLAATVFILCLSVPILEQMLDLIETVLGGL